MTKKEKLQLLMVETSKKRLENLKNLLEEEDRPPKKRPEFANNHIHTTYSFSPYSPTAAVYFAREAGLETGGIMDHDSIGGAKEFKAAGEIAGVATTCGIECRISMKETSLGDKRFNNPDQKGIAYILIHSVMPDKYDFVQEVFTPLRKHRNERNKKMIQKINQLLEFTGIALDFEEDVLPVSLYNQGGTITERHILWALSGKLLKHHKVDQIPKVLEQLGMELRESEKAKFVVENLDIQYDLLGIFKAYFVEQFYVDADEECMTLKEAIIFAKDAGGILCYSYLGDVKESVTGDKKEEKYEDDYLEELFEMVYKEGVRAITYSPSRNTKEQIKRVQSLCKKYNMLEISGEDINTPGQSFICEKLVDPEFRHLVDETWNLVKREKL